MAEQPSCSVSLKVKDSDSIIKIDAKLTEDFLVLNALAADGCTYSASLPRCSETGLDAAELFSLLKNSKVVPALGRFWVIILI